MKRKIPVLIALAAVTVAAFLSACTPVFSVPTATLSAEEAKAIAVEDAGLTLSQVFRLRAEYEIDDGIPQYDVEFRYDGFEYTYEIHADTGKILSFEKDR